MAFELGTYGSSVFSPMLGYCLPQPNEAITWDWMDTVGLFTQRFRRMATTIATVATGGTTTFDYTTLQDDYFPPYLRAYYYDSGWHEYAGSMNSLINGLGYTVFAAVGLGTAKFINNTGDTRSWLLTAYL